jgi:hypothetical protein
MKRRATPVSPYPKDDREFIAHVFKEFDTDGSGILNGEKLAPLLQRLNGMDDVHSSTFGLT